MKSSPFHNQIRLLALLAAFVLACAGCVWLFLHSGRANRRQEAEPVSASAQTAEAAALPNFAAPVLYDAQSEVTEELPDDHAWQQEIFPYGDDLVQLNYGGDDALFAAVSAPLTTPARMPLRCAGTMPLCWAGSAQSGFW